MEFYSQMALCIVFIIVGFDLLYLIDVYQLEFILFIVILYIVWSDSIYIHFQSTFISTVAIFIRLSKIFINCIVIIFNHADI